MVQISVVMCTYNRDQMLPSALESLAKQTLDKSLYEVILVDNASTDNTSKVAKEFSLKHSDCNFRVVYEPCPGLGYARNTGFKHTKGDYVAFIDDDALAEKNWLRHALECFGHVKPSPLVLGGPYHPHYRTRKPEWFKDEFEIRTWGNRPRFLSRGENYFSGSNMVLTRKVLRKYGGFDVRVGMKGEYVSTGEETSLFSRIMEHEDKPNIFYYSPQLIVFHAVPGYKMTVSYQLKRAFAKGQARYIRAVPAALGDRLRLMVKIMLSISALFCSALMLKERQSAFKSWLVGSLIPIVAEIGHFSGCLGIIIPMKEKLRAG